jgi:hypothetical protein
MAEWQAHRSSMDQLNSVSATRPSGPRDGAVAAREAWAGPLAVGLVDRMVEYRERRIERLDAVLGKIPGCDKYPWGGEAASDLPLRYALAHQIYEWADRAVRSGCSAEELHAALSLRTDQSALAPLHTVAGPVIVAHPLMSELSVSPKPPGVDTGLRAPIFLLTPHLGTPASAGERDLVAGALDAAAAAGFGPIVERNTRIVALLTEREPADDIVRSWTSWHIPATTHTDYFASRFHSARELIHEAAHSELNDLFAAFGFRLPSGSMFYSPWRRERRPLFGFLHGTWAFSHVGLYCAWVMQADVPAEIAETAGEAYQKCIGYMRESHTELSEAIAEVSAPELAKAIIACRDALLESS